MNNTSKDFTLETLIRIIIIKAIFLIYSSFKFYTTITYHSTSWNVYHVYIVAETSNITFIRLLKRLQKKVYILLYIYKTNSVKGVQDKSTWDIVSQNG